MLVCLIIRMRVIVSSYHAFAIVGIRWVGDDSLLSFVESFTWIGIQVRKKQKQMQPSKRQRQETNLLLDWVLKERQLRSKMKQLIWLKKRSWVIEACQEQWRSSLIDRGVDLNEQRSYRYDSSTRKLCALHAKWERERRKGGYPVTRDALGK